MTPLEHAERIAEGRGCQSYPDVDAEIWQMIEHELVCTLDYGVVTFDTYFAIYPGQGLAFLDELGGDHG
jgi:acetoacetate decarboxylase